MTTTPAWTRADSEAEHFQTDPNCCNGCKACPLDCRECCGCQRTCECYTHPDGPADDD